MCMYIDLIYTHVVHAVCSQSVTGFVEDARANVEDNVTKAYQVHTFVCVGPTVKRINPTCTLKVGHVDLNFFLSSILLYVGLLFYISKLLRLLQKYIFLS